RRSSDLIDPTRPPKAAAFNVHERVKSYDVITPAAKILLGKTCKIDNRIFGIARVCDHLRDFGIAGGKHLQKGHRGRGRIDPGTARIYRNQATDISIVVEVDTWHLKQVFRVLEPAPGRSVRHSFTGVLGDATNRTPLDDTQGDGLGRGNVAPGSMDEQVSQQGFTGLIDVDQSRRRDHVDEYVAAI